MPRLSEDLRNLVPVSTGDLRVIQTNSDGGAWVANIVAFNGSQFTPNQQRIYVRRGGGFNNGATSIQTPPTAVRIAPGRGIDTSIGRQVWVVKGYDGELYAESNVAADLEAAGVTPRQLNPADPARKYTVLEAVVNLSTFPDGSAAVKLYPSMYRKTDGTYALYQGGTLDILTPHQPATADTQVVVGIYLDPDTNTVSSYASAAFSQNTILADPANLATGIAAINETAAQAPAGAIGMTSYIVRSDDTVIGDTNKYQDLRGIIGAGTNAPAVRAITSTSTIPSGTTAFFIGPVRLDGTLTVNGSVHIL